ncbi:fluoride efflux transporter CrcB [Neisseria sp. Ec49-e6-T10]|uniref:fluoride efflux transporter CrcB n=1 Tax=Neisseria sp. Ec49-e6-T10 TaxID=3140744 RepID=UPI003EB7324A
MTIREILLVFVGGGLGSATRFVLSRFLNTHNMPWGTLVINIVGCFLIGALAGLLGKTSIDKALYAFLAVGFCGGFTTFSSFGLENVLMLESDQFLKTLCYIIFSVVLGIGAAYLGLKYTR